MIFAHKHRITKEDRDAIAEATPRFFGLLGIVATLAGVVAICFLALGHRDGVLRWLTALL